MRNNRTQNTEVRSQKLNPPINPFCLSLRGEAEAISRIDVDSLASKGEIPRGIYPEQSDEILRYAQNDRRRRARNDRLRSSSNEKGIALVIILILTAIALVIMAGLIYMITTGTQISGMEKKYKTAQEAAVGSVDITYEFIGLRGDSSKNTVLLNELASINPAITTSNSCTGTNILGTTFTGLAAKLNTRTTNPDGTSNWDPTYCYPNSMSIIPGTSTTYDMRFDLGTSPYPTYRVYAKIVNTVEGNSGPSEGLIGVGVVTAGSGEVVVVHKPYLYTIEVDAEDKDNPSERAKYSILYQY